ncbi:MAG: DUF2281 domain-containing protein [Pirellulales bacterium]|nr:DUF2281 domain-containing protein [Pirellulales bacterium]
MSREQVNQMHTVSLDVAKAQLSELIQILAPGEELVIVEKGEPLATLVRAHAQHWPCRAGSAKETKHWMAPDFDAPLEEFREYMG